MRSHFLHWCLLQEHFAKQRFTHTRAHTLTHSHTLVRDLDNGASNQLLGGTYSRKIYILYWNVWKQIPANNMLRMHFEGEEGARQYSMLLFFIWWNICTNHELLNVGMFRNPRPSVSSVWRWTLMMMHWQCTSRCFYTLSSFNVAECNVMLLLRWLLSRLLCCSIHTRRTVVSWRHYLEQNQIWSSQKIVRVGRTGWVAAPYLLLPSL